MQELKSDLYERVIHDVAIGVMDTPLDRTWYKVDSMPPGAPAINGEQIPRAYWESLSPDLQEKITVLIDMRTRREKKRRTA